jgi:hypothetical protein
VIVLSQFIFRLSFGMALAMAITPARLVTSGYYRNHLYVLLGLNVLASLAAFSSGDALLLWPPMAAAGASYIGAVAWLYEKPKPGKAALLAVAAITLAGAMLGSRFDSRTSIEQTLEALSVVASGCLLGATIAAMFLGHWYLNTPTMQLAPLRRLVAAMGAAVALRAIVSAVGLTLQIGAAGAGPFDWQTFMAIRWLSGLLGAGLLAWMTWQTLKIPNTQSATGILYVGVIVTFLGEITAMLLSAESIYPL